MRWLCGEYVSGVLTVNSVRERVISRIVHAELVEFQTISEKFIAITATLSKRVDYEKMRTIGLQTQLKSMAKHRANQQQELQVNRELNVLSQRDL